MGFFTNSFPLKLQLERRLLFSLLVVLLAATSHLPKPAQAQTACYTSAPWFRRTKTDITKYSSFFGTSFRCGGQGSVAGAAPFLKNKVHVWFKDVFAEGAREGVTSPSMPPSFRVTLAANASDCKRIVGEVKCNQSAPANFFVFSEAGQFKNNSANIGNCAYGDSCRPLPAGTAYVTTGVMTPVTCPGPPPAPLAPVFCPGNGWPLRNVYLNSSLTIYNFLGSAIDLVDAANAADCKRQAQASKCGGSGYTHFVYMKRGFTDPVIGSIGNCAFGNGCASLSPGYTPAVFGKLTATCATF